MTISAIIRAVRKWVIGKRIAAAQWDQRFYMRHLTSAFEQMLEAEERERLLGQKLTEVDHPLPMAILRSRIGT